MSFRNTQPSFSGGEVSDAVGARIDVAKRATALARARNVLGMAQGGQYNRPGFLFADEVYDSEQIATLKPFVFSAGDSYALEFTPGKMRIYYRGQLVTRPRLTITGITKAAQAVVTAPAHGYQVGWIAVFDGVQGMVEINSLRGRIVSVTTDTFVVDIDTTGFSTFTADTGGVGGASGGGTGGYPAPPPPGEDPPPPETPNIPTRPPITPPQTGGNDMAVIP